MMIQASSGGHALTRLRYIGGHLAGIRRMIEREELCIEIIRQTHAVRRAIQNMEALLVRAHFETCVVPAVGNGDKEQSLKELVQLYAMHSERRECDGSLTRNP